jgi:hypothetical protein
MTMFAKAKDLFEYRIRMMFGGWYLLTNTGDLGPMSYRDCKREAAELERIGYVDGDR